MARSDKVEIEIILRGAAAARDVKTFVRDAEGGFKKIRRGADTAGKGFLSLSRHTDSLKRNFLSLKTAVGGLVAGFAAYKALGVAKSFLDVASSVENYHIRLTTLLGSQQAANQAMKFFNEIAARTPATLGEVIEAGTTLTAMGADYQKWIPVLNDLAAVMGIKMPEAASALGRAYAGGAGAADIFRERGILQIIKGFAKLKYGIDDITDIELPKFQKIMYEAFTDPGGKIAGAGEALAKGWTGMISMISDAWFRFRQKVMDSKPFDYLKAGVGQVINYLDGLKTSGKLDEWARTIGEKSVAYFKTALLGAARFADMIVPIIQSIGERAKSLWEAFRTLPAWVQEAGIVAAFLGGKKGTLLLIAGVHLLEMVQNQIKATQAIKAGKLTWGEFAKMDFGELEKWLKENMQEAGEKAGGTLAAGMADGLAKEAGTFEQKALEFIKKWDQAVAEMKKPEEATQKVSEHIDKGKQELVYFLEGERRVLGAANDMKGTFSILKDTTADTKYTALKEDLEELNSQMKEMETKAKEIKRLMEEAKSGEGAVPMRYGGILPSAQHGIMLPGFSLKDKYLVAMRGGEAGIPPESVNYYGKNFIRGLIDRTIPKESLMGKEKGYFVLDHRFEEGKSFPVKVTADEIGTGLMEYIKKSEKTRGHF
jgi:hypothetical protein